MNLIERLYLRQKNNLVYYDALTGLHNRLYYDREVKRRYQPTATKVAYIDVNNLKLINDTDGHSAGSRHLQNIAFQLRKCGHVELCRVGGDEFVMIGSCTGLEKVEGISYGVYEKEAYEDVSSSVKKADESMYLSKNQKNARFDVPMSEPMTPEMASEILDKLKEVYSHIQSVNKALEYVLELLKQSTPKE